MRRLPAIALPEQEQQNLNRKLYLLLGEQVKRYHKAHRMGESTSIRSELAQELLTSVLYTLDQVGSAGAYSDLDEGLKNGQNILQAKLENASALFHLVEVTAPSWQGESRWETVSNIAVYLRNYDLHHLAHLTPEQTIYPFIVPVPNSLMGLDCALYMLKLLWIENQIITSFPADTQNALWDIFCQNDRGLTENQCQQLLTNAIGKHLICSNSVSIIFNADEYGQLIHRLQTLQPAQIEPTLQNALAAVLKSVNIINQDAVTYAQHCLSELALRIHEGLKLQHIDTVFL